MKLTGIMITRNEIHHVEAAVSNLMEVCDEVLVVDSGSTDGTVEAAEKLGARVEFREWTGYRDQRNFGHSRADTDWVLVLDADERLSPELVEQIQKWKQNPLKNHVHGIAFKRKLFFMGKWFRNNVLNCEWKVRLYNRHHAQWAGGSVHERLHIQGKTEKIRAFILHYAYKGVDDLFFRLKNYADLRARDYYASGKRPSVLWMILNVEATFIKKYILQMKFLGGTAGLILAWLETHYTAIKYMKLYELQLQGKTGEMEDE